MQKVNKIYVIGIGFRPLDNAAAKALLGSEVVLANNRLFDVFKNYADYEKVKDKILVHGSVYEMLDYIRDNYREKKIALLAAGDPMFFGIGRLAVERFGKDAVEVHPDLSSIQVAFSRICESSNDALLISLHGGPDPTKRRELEYELSDLPSLLVKHNKIAILTDKMNNPSVIAEVIARRSIRPTKQSKNAEIASPAARNDIIKMYVCEKLGYPDEKITGGKPDDIANREFEHPNVALIIRNSEHRAQNTDIPLSPTPYPLPPVLGLRENEIQHTKGLITKDEVRAVTIHKLRLPERGVLWDIGAGSGAVSIEAARLCPGLKIFAIEKDEEQINNIVANISKFSITNIEIVKGEAPEALRDLPSPNKVFIGGSSGKLEGIIEIIRRSHELTVMSYELKDSTLIIVINATTIETLNEAVQSLERSGFKIDISEISVSRSKTIGGKRHMSALNPIFIVTGEKL